MYRSDHGGGSRRSSRWAVALFVFYAVASTTTVFSVAYGLMHHPEVRAAVVALIAAEVVVSAGWAAVCWCSRVRRRRGGCAQAAACVCGSKPGDDREVVAHADQWVGWNTDGVVGRLTAQLRAHVAAADAVPVRWTLRHWCHLQGWRTAEAGIGGPDTANLCCPVDVVWANAPDGQRYVVVRVGRREPTVYYRRAGRWNDAFDIDVVCGNGHRWTWFGGFLHGADINYASAAQVFGPGHRVPLTVCAGKERCTSPSWCRRRAARCPLCAASCHLTPSLPVDRQAASTGDAQPEPAEARTDLRVFGREEFRVERVTAADGAFTFTVWKGFHNLTGWQPLTAMPDADELRKLHAEPASWGLAYPPLPGARRRDAVRRVTGTLKAAASGRRRRRRRRRQPSPVARCRPGCSCRAGIPTRSWYERAASQQVWLQGGQPRIVVQAWLDQRVAGRDTFHTRDMQNSPLIGYYPTLKQLRAWCRERGLTVRDQVSHSSRFLEYRVNVVLAAGPDGVRYAVVCVEDEEPVVYVDRTVDPAAWRTVRPVVAACLRGHSLTWAGDDLLTDPVAGDLPVAALFGPGRKAPVQLCRSCTYTELGHIDVFCVQHRGFLGLWDVPEAVYCPVCGELCELGLPSVATEPGTAAAVQR